MFNNFGLVEKLLSNWLNICVIMEVLRSFTILGSNCHVITVIDHGRITMTVIY